MPAAMTLINSQTISVAAATVTFSSFASTYRDLYIVFTGTSTVAANISIFFNSDLVGTNYARVNMRGDGSTTGSAAASTDSIISNVDTVVNTALISVMDYSQTDKQKTVLSRGSSTGSWVMATAARWANTAAVTQVALTCNGSTFAAGSTFYLYGIAG